MFATTAFRRTFAFVIFLMTLVAGVAHAADAPASLHALKSTRAQCTEAAREALARAEAAGIPRERMQWLYGRKPFANEGHVSLVVDGWIVDNGGLGRDLWNAPVCPGNVCRLEEARRALDDSFLEPVDREVRTTFESGEWALRVASSGRR